MDQSDLSGMDGLERLYRGRVAARPVVTERCVSPEAMLALLQREGTEDERFATLEHVMSCPACHREYQWLAAVDRAAVEAGATPAARRPWWRSAPLALAASLVAVVGAALLARAPWLNGGEATRGETGDVALVTPAAGATIAGSSTFAWHPLPEAPAYVLEIQRADGSVARSDTTADTTLALPGAALPPAEYRWWVREVTDGSEPRSSAFRTMRVTAQTSR
jgi:hypothetical protein